MNETQIQTLIPNIKKRNGAIVPFNQDKVTLAISKAFHATGKDNESMALKISDKVIERIFQEKQTAPENSIPTVEHIQDIVEEELMKAGETKVAKSFILYRSKRTEERELKHTMLGLNIDTKVGINQLRVLKERYLLKDESGKLKETPEQLWRRVANNIAQAELQFGGTEESVKYWSDKFAVLMENMEFMPNTPTLMNAGTDIQQLSACFVLPVEDSIEGIYETMKHQALIHQSGGGTGFSFSRLRPKGSLVRSTKGVATGPIGFMTVYNASTEVIKQGGKRRGANMGILRVDHPDIHEFIHCKDDITKINNFNISVALTEKFMEAVESGEEFELIDPHNKQVVRRENAKLLFDELVTSAWKSGDPGIIFIDRINRDNTVPHIYTIEATNPCVTGDTLISTANGLMRMEQLVEKSKSENVQVVTDNRVPIHVPQSNGSWMLMDADQRGVSTHPISRAFSSGVKEVFTLETRSGYEINCTTDHKIYTNKGFVPLNELNKETHRIYIQSGEGRFSLNKNIPFEVTNNIVGENNHIYQHNFPTQWSNDLGQVIGWLVGDGWLRTGDEDRRVGFVFAKEDEEVRKKLEPIIQGYYGHPLASVTRDGVTHLSYHSQPFVDFFLKLGVAPVDSEEKIVPEAIYQAPYDATVGFLQGVFTADGTANFVESNGTAYIRLTSRSIKLIKGVQKLLINMGIKSNIYDRSREERKLFQYTTIHGVEKTYSSDGKCFELNISSESLKTFIMKIGFIGKKAAEKIEQFNQHSAHRTIFEEEIKSITSIGKREVFDLTEPHSHSFIGNGIVISNCGEQPLGPFDSCNLGSINLVKYITPQGEVDWPRLRETIRTVTRFLDNTIDMNKYVIPQIEKMNKGNRRIGLGVMGWADLLFKLGISYNSEEGCEFAEKMAKFIRDEADAMSQELGREKGTFPHIKGSTYDVPNGPTFRNCARITIAPTGTISMIADCSSGIEPLFAISFVKRVMDGQELLYVNEIFKENAIKRGFYSEELMEKIAREGTAAHCEEIPEDVRKTFVCAHDISPYWHLRMQAAWQKYTDNAISKTVNFSHNASVDDVREVYTLAYKLGCKGVTIYRDGSKGFENQVLNLNVEGKSNKQVEDDYKAKVMQATKHDLSKGESKKCTKCGGNKLHMQEGCATCMDCGYSYCSV
jgi:ribonucleoside-diphosphate reductase alpha chain